MALDLTSARAIGDAIGFGVAVAGGAIGDGLVFSRLVEGVARQPEALGRLLTWSLVGVGLVEAWPVIAFVYFVFANLKG